MIIDRIKISAYNAEEWLLDRLLRHNSNPHDIRAMLRSFAELAGEICATTSGVTLTLDAPEIPLNRRSASAMRRGPEHDWRHLPRHHFPAFRSPTLSQCTLPRSPLDLSCRDI